MDNADNAELERRGMRRVTKYLRDLAARKLEVVSRLESTAMIELMRTKAGALLEAAAAVEEGIEREEDPEKWAALDAELKAKRDATWAGIEELTKALTKHSEARKG